MKLNVVKIGGNVIEHEERLAFFLKAFAELEGLKILVHGGGKEASLMAEKLNIPVKMIDGRRCTDADTLTVITMLYAGKINKNIVAKLQALQCNAMGMSGADANLILSKKRTSKPIDFGWVGDIASVDSAAIRTLLENLKITPVFCALTHDGSGQLLNTNADSIASALAVSMANFFTVELWYCFEQNGVLKNRENPDSIIEKIDFKTYQNLKNEHLITDGMIPKLDNCFHAIDQNVHAVHIGSLEMLQGATVHTTIIPNL